MPLQVVAVLLRLQDVRLRKPGQRGVVLVLGASSWQRDTLRRELQRIDPAIRQRAAAAVGSGGSARAAGGALGARGAPPAGLACGGAVCTLLHPPVHQSSLGLTWKTQSQSSRTTATRPLNPALIHGSGAPRGPPSLLC